MTKGTVVTTINVGISPRADYWLATSDDLAGLNVCAPSLESVCERVIEAIKLLYKLNQKLDVDVYPATDNKTFPVIGQACDRFAVAAHQLAA
jgi:hypothetical protein